MSADKSLDHDTVKAVLAEYKIHNADINVRCEKVTVDMLIDVIEGNRYREGRAVLHTTLVA